MHDPRIKMTAALQAAIDSIAFDKPTIYAIDERARSTSPLAKLYAALAQEMGLSRMRQAEVLFRLEADHRAHVDAVDLRVNGPLPQREGRPGHHNPETGEWTY